MDGIKESKQAVAGDVLTSMSGFAPPLLLALGSRLVTLSPRLNMHTATTNVPGPQQPVQTLPPAWQAIGISMKAAERLQTISPGMETTGRFRERLGPRVEWAAERSNSTAAVMWPCLLIRV